MSKYLQLLSILSGCPAADRVGVQESFALTRLTLNGARHDISTYTSSQWLSQPDLTHDFH